MDTAILSSRTRTRAAAHQKKQTKSIAYENATHFHLPLNMTFL
ncbi:hypothetical protein DP49_4206 [Burkholderia pseudomallei]|nr:conserved hypothetical protein [Burkholderia pseudomallei Pakistan 9]KGD57235.1 hypothetical protein DP49_4206 [Burkholderia pseudomallei]